MTARTITKAAATIIAAVRDLCLAVIFGLSDVDEGVVTGGAVKGMFSVSLISMATSPMC